MCDVNSQIINFYDQRSDFFDVDELYTVLMSIIVLLLLCANN